MLLPDKWAELATNRAHLHSAVHRKSEGGMLDHQLVKAREAGEGMLSGLL